MNYWLIKSEPSVYSWEQFEKDGSTTWDGVRSYAARNNLRDMKKGDQVFYYHSNVGLEIVGIAKVSKEHFQDPTSDVDTWLTVELKPYKKLKKPVSLTEMKAEKKLQQLQLIKIGRLSVSVVRPEEFETILAMGNTK